MLLQIASINPGFCGTLSTNSDQKPTLLKKEYSVKVVTVLHRRPTRQVLYAMCVRIVMTTWLHRSELNY